MGGHGGRAAAMGRAGIHAHRACGDADAGARRSDGDVHSVVRRTRHRRRRARRVARAGNVRSARMSEAFGLPEILAAIIVLSLNAYVLTGGADFGGGVWDLLARGPRRAAQRALIASQIGPIWEANHVWLILVVVLLSTAFPAAFAALGIVLHVPLSLMLIGIVLRGSSFVFRSYGARDDATQQRWGRVFAMASVLTPVLLGIVVGAVATGDAGAAADRLVAARDVSYASTYLAPWLAPFPLAMGALALAMFAFLAAVYLALATDDAALREDFRRRALGAEVAMFIAAFGGLAVAHATAPQ